MEAKEIVEYYGTQAEVARQVGLKRSAIKKWFTSKNGVPIKHQRVLHLKSKGKLKIG